MQQQPLKSDANESAENSWKQQTNKTSLEQNLHADDDEAVAHQPVGRPVADTL